MKISYKEIADTALILKLDQAAFCREFDCPFKSEEEVKKYFANSKALLILDGKEPAGYYSYKYVHPDEAEITGIVVIPSYQGKGIDSMVLKKILSELKNVKKVWLLTHPKNIAALKLYFKFGFVITGWKDNYFGDGEPRLILQSKNIA